MKEITVCTMDCPDACSLEIYTDDNGNPHIRGNRSHPVTAGFICPKIRDHVLRLKSPSRIVTPMIRDRGAWKTISWKAAYGLCAEKIQEYRKEPLSILHVSGSGAKGVLKNGVKLFFDLLGASRVKGSVCDSAGLTAFLKDFGSRFNHDIRDMLRSRRIVNWGKDLSRSSIHMAAMVRKARKKGARVLVISPGGDGNGSFADEFIRIRPGTDRFLAAAAIRLFMERGRIDEKLLDHSRGFEGLRDEIFARSQEGLLSVCGVDREDLERLFGFYNDSGPPATLIGAGLQRYRYGGENVRFINALCFVSGNIGRSGGGSYYHLDSLRNLNLDWTDDPQRVRRRTFFEPVIGREILEAKDPPVRMIWVNGFNVVNQAPESGTVARALKQVSFKVVVDAFMTDTAQRADLFLPSKLMLEQEDIVGSYLHDFVQHACAMLEAPGEARDDYRIVSELGLLLDPPVVMPDADTCFRLSLQNPVLKTTLEELRRQRYVRAVRPEIPYEDLRFDHADGRYRFPSRLHEEEAPSEGYPLRLLSLVRGDRIHSQILPEDQAGLPRAWVAPDSPALDGIDPGGEVFLASPLGRMRVALETLPGLHPEAVLYRRGDWMCLGGGVNRLIAAGLTDMGNGAPFYEQYVRLEKG